ncbi:MAG TPA: ferritin-like domain-containing protein, partial [Chloroflexia bacterium]|nr:ferritin-like domain-containing protein [Chloroflexia bacterium]
MSWYDYFRQNAASRMAIPWERGIEVESALRGPLVRSLQRFQVGEKGDGKHLIRSAAATGDPEYAATVELFIKEEQAHSALLARLLDGMGAPLIGWHWSDACFVLVRRLSGLKLELMVLLAAEMIAKRYYRALYEGTADPVLRAAFGQIIHDEDGHVAFHCDYLGRAFRPLPLLVRLAVMGAWYAFYGTVVRVVA